MAEALSKARKVAEKLKTTTSETEFEQWYEIEVLKKNAIANDLLTFAEAIVEAEFWGRPSRTRRRRDRNNPSVRSSWYEVYGRFYKLLPQSGEGGIRTLEQLPVTAFPVLRLRPLGHLSR
jgi:uncharacterized protein YhaN